MSKKKTRNYKVEGNKDFLILAIVFFCLCIWAIKDAWYPSEKVLRKHPREIIISYPEDGFIQNINVSVNDSINNGDVIVSLGDEKEVTLDWKKGGEVKEIFKNKYDSVTADEPIAVIIPKDTFYSFNQTLAIFSGIACIGFLFIHKYH